MALSKRRKLVRELDVVVADNLGSILDAQLSGGGGGGTESTGVGFEGSNGNSIVSAGDDARDWDTRLALLLPRHPHGSRGRTRHQAATPSLSVSTGPRQLATASRPTSGNRVRRGT